jgi:ATP-binding cassette subfamily B protein
MRNKLRSIRRQLGHGAGFIKTSAAMLALSWQVQPLVGTGLVFLLIVQGLLPLGIAWVLKLLFDLLAHRLQAQTSIPLSTLAPQVILLLLAQASLLGASQGVGLLTPYYTAEVGRQLSLRIKTRLYQKLNSFSDLFYFEDPHLQNTIQLASSNAEAGPQQALATFSALLQGLVMLLAFLGTLVAFNPILAALLLVAALPTFVVQIKFGHQRFGVALHNSPRERRATYYGHLLSWVQSAKEIRLFNVGPYFLHTYVEQTRHIQQTQRLQQRREIRWQLPLSLLSSLVSTGALAFVIIQAVTGILSLGDVTLYLSAVSSVQGTLLSLVVASAQLYQGVLFYRQYLELLALPQTSLTSNPARPVPPLTVGITFRNVSFRYGDQQPWVLRHVDLFLPANACLALVGLNGAGKTTFVKLLTRLYDPTEGAILWDGIDLRAFDPAALRQHLGVILQDFMHYDLTAQQNIGLGQVSQIEQDDIVQQAALKAAIHERLAALPQGYQTFLGRWLAEEGQGVDLSGGEWQKLALARLFMREAEVLILDEPTASLDAQAEEALYTHVRTQMQGRTSLLISHRFSTICLADRIAVLEQGQITEEGTHTDLLARGGTYATLYTLQAQRYSSDLATREA